MHLKTKNQNVLNLFHFQKSNITFSDYMFSQKKWYTLRLPFLFFDLEFFLIYLNLLL
jgi:hypothetical protein